MSRTSECLHLKGVAGPSVSEPREPLKSTAVGEMMSESTQCQYCALALMERETHALDQWTSGGNRVPFEGFLERHRWLIIIWNEIYRVFGCKVNICNGTKHSVACQIYNMRETSGDAAWVVVLCKSQQNFKTHRTCRSTWLNLMPRFFRLRSRDLRNVSLFVALSMVIHPICLQYL